METFANKIAKKMVVKELDPQTGLEVADTLIASVTIIPETLIEAMALDKAKEQEGE